MCTEVEAYEHTTFMTQIQLELVINHFPFMVNSMKLWFQQGE
jgi:hypothetical protein